LFTSVYEIACVLPNVEADQVRVQQTLKIFFSFVEGLEHGGGGECLMEVEPYVGFNFLALTDVVGHEHVLVSMDPYCVRIYLSTDFLYTSCYPAVDRLEFVPVV